MSDKRDKAGDPDPDATVTFQRSSLMPPPDDPDATVTLQRSSLTALPDDDATVMIPAGLAAAATPPAAKPDEDATVMIPPRSAPAYDEDATVMMSPRPATPVADDDATVMMTAESIAAERAAEAAAAAAAATTVAAAAATPAATAVETPPAAEAPAAPVAPVAPDGNAAGMSPPPVPASRMPWIAGAVVIVLAGLFFALKGGKEPAAPASVPAAASAPANPPAAAPSAPAAAAPVAAAAAPAPSPTPAAAAPAPAAAAPADLKKLLSGQIKRGQIAVTESGGASMISLQDAHQFSSGGVDPDPRLKSIIAGVAAVLDKVPGEITVIGHTDDTKSGSARFPSNEALSAARAEAVAKEMAGKLGDPKRIKSEGAAATQPLVANDSVANRAKNRRVVILFKPAP